MRVKKYQIHAIELKLEIRLFFHDAVGWVVDGQIKLMKPKGSQTFTKGKYGHAFGDGVKVHVAGWQISKNDDSVKEAPAFC